MKCELCGNNFHENEAQKACKSCPISKSCNLIKCPNCGYETPKVYNVINTIKNYAKRIINLINKNNAGVDSKNSNFITALCLTDIKKRTHGKITHLKTKDNKNLHKMLVMGLLPGITIELMQKFPSYVLKVGHSQLAIGEEIAKDIYIQITD